MPEVLALQVNNKIKLIFIILIPLLFYIAVIILSHYNLINCVWKTITGHECLGCGITRAFYSLFKGDLKNAYEANPLIIIIAPLMLILWIKLIIKNTPNK